MKIIKNALIEEKGEKKLINILYDEKILEISKNSINSKNAEEIDLKGKLLIPGGIDSHVHFNDPGFLAHESFLTGTMAASFAGITTIIDMPCTNLPPISSVENLENKLKIISPKAFVDYALWGGIRGNDKPFYKKEILKLWEAGVIGFKMYTVSGMDTFQAVSYEDIKNIFSIFDKENILFAFHAEDANVIKEATNKLNQEELAQWKNYVKSRPVKAEVVAVDNIIKIMQNNICHFVHISSKEACKLILEAKEKNKNISFETCPHYLQFTQSDYEKYLGYLKTAPSVKFEEDKLFLRKMLQEEKIDFVATDHAGCRLEEKTLSNFSKVYCGIPGIETLILYLVDEFYLKEKISYENLLNITSRNAAKRYNLYPQKGEISINSDADFCVLDLEENFVLNQRFLHSKGKYSPFHKRNFHCQIYMTVLRGKIIYSHDEGFCSSKGYGKFVKRNLNFSK